MNNKQTKFISFYSHKGGVGRSMALTNVAYLLARDGKKVCIIDFDLEAPGQHQSDLFRDISLKSGLLELMNHFQKYYEDDSIQKFEWDINQYSIYTTELDKLFREKRLKEKPGDLYLIPSGNIYNESYKKLLSELDWQKFYQKGGARFFASLKAKLVIEGFDYILIDSRTGFSDIFYISTLSLSDTAVLISAMNRQNIEGIKEAYDVISSSQAKETYGEKNIILVNSPFPDIDPENLSRRDEEIKQEWKGFSNWHIRLPYKPYLALKETTAVYEKDKLNSTENSYYKEVWELKNIILNEEYTQLIEDTNDKPTNPFELYRADYQNEKEWIKYYVDPGDIIQNAMKSFMPTLIFGSRGSGKTTLGKILSYETQILKQQGETNPESFEYIGLYFKLDVDILRMFDTKEKELKEYFDKLFGQYFDLIIFRKAIKALDKIAGLNYWLNEKDLKKFVKRILKEIGEEFDKDESLLEQLNDQTEDSISNIRAHLNNPKEVKKPYNIQPNILMKLLVEHLLKDTKFDKKYFIIFMDEYENFRDYQQMIVNTRLKQTKENDRVTYKLLMRDGGLHTPSTYATGQTIQVIHDYQSYNLVEMFDYQQFYKHAKDIVNRYLELNPYFSKRGYSDIDDILKSISIEEEANSIGGRKNVLENWLERNYTKEIKKEFESWFKIEKNILRQTVGILLLNQGKPHKEIIENFTKNTQKAKDWYHNYHKGALFWLYTLKNTTKQYSGFNSIVGLSGNNIRTTLDFCYSIIQKWLSKEEFNLPVTISLQSSVIADKSLEYKKLLKIEQEYCQDVDNLVERLGRLFEVIHKSPRQSEPEINHFAIKDDLSKEVDDILKIAYRTTALRKLQENKQKSIKDTRGDAWQLHPRFAAHFGISTRKKKQISFSNDELKTIIYGNTKEWNSFMKDFEKKYKNIKQDTNKSEGATLFD